LRLADTSVPVTLIRVLRAMFTTCPTKNAGNPNLAAQRAIDTRRSHFQAPIFRAFDLQQILAAGGDFFAILNRHKTVGSFGGRWGR
jgi:hypothetical protein